VAHEVHPFGIHHEIQQGVAESLKNLMSGFLQNQILLTILCQLSFRR